MVKGRVSGFGLWGLGQRLIVRVLVGGGGAVGPGEPVLWDVGMRTVLFKANAAS